MRYILGVSAYYHDSAAALLCDGEVVAAAQEERFTRKRHDADFPNEAIAYCLREAKCSLENIDLLIFYDKPLRKFDRILETYLAYAPRGFSSFRQALPLWLGQKLDLRSELRSALGDAYKGPIAFSEHHASHAASAFFPSPFERAAILTCDGVGEWATTTWGLGEGNRISLEKSLSFPHSLGLLYSAFTYFTGFKVNSGEYKLMGLAPYGEPVYADLIRKKLIDLKPDGSLRLRMEYFTFGHGLRMTGDAFDKLFGGPARSPEAPITKREMDLAASIQVVTEDAMLAMAAHVKEQTRAEYLCLAGGVALNCVANGKIAKAGLFRDIWIQPASGDAGGALGAATHAWHSLLKKPRQSSSSDKQKGSLLGPSYNNEQVRSAFDQAGAIYEFIGDEASLLTRVASLLADGKVVGWFHGRMEFGPRALGARSILGDSRNTAMQSVMNVKIKFRESFRPFAPVVLKERVRDWFDLPEGMESPYMLVVADVLEKHRTKLSTEEQAAMRDPDLRKRVNVARSSLPAITHVDYSARLQTVDAERHGRFHRLMQEFERQTGCPVLVNTSFNVRGEPIVCTPKEALTCFLHTDMDVLVVENCLLLKEKQPARTEAEREKYRSKFSLD